MLAVDYAAARREERLVARAEIIIEELLRPGPERAPDWGWRARAWLADLRIFDELTSIEEAARAMSMERHISQRRLYGLPVETEEVLAFQRLLVQVLEELAGQRPAALELVMAARATLGEMETEFGLSPSVGVRDPREERVTEPTEADVVSAPGLLADTGVSDVNGSRHPIDDPDAVLLPHGEGSPPGAPSHPSDITHAAMLGGAPEAEETPSPGAPSGAAETTRQTPRRRERGSATSTADAAEAGDG